MNTTDTRTPGIALLFAQGDEPAVGHTTWNQITKAGRYEGHRQGVFSFDATTTAQLLANFAANGDGRVPVDYEHTSEALPENAAQEGVPAVAWIVAVEDRDGDVWGCFEWVSPRAVEYVRAGQYRYVSPAVNFAARDKVTGQPCGARLTSVALTNHPFLDGMEPLTASDRPVTASLSPEAVHVPAAIAVVPTPKPKRPPMDEAQMKAAADMAAKYTALAARVCKLADLDPEAGEDAALEQLEKKVADMKKAQAAEAASMADRVVKSGRAPEAARAKLTALCLSDRDTFEALYPAPVATPDAKLMSARVAPQGGQAPAAVEPPAQPERHTDAAHEGAVKLMAADKSLTYSAALVESSRALRDEAMATVLNSMKGAV